MKRKIIALILAISVLSAFCAPVMAADAALVSGFYDIGTNKNTVITPWAGNTQVSATEKDVDSDEDFEQFYENADRLSVTFGAATENENYGVILVNGSGLPTVDTKIYYINQEKAEDANIAFDVYPKLPVESTDMTLYISSSKKDFTLVNIPLNYAVNVSATEPEPVNTPGDVNDDGEVDEEDVSLIRKHITGGYGVQINVETANVNEDNEIDVKDIILIRRHIAGGYNVELK